MSVSKKVLGMRTTFGRLAEVAPQSTCSSSELCESGVDESSCYTKGALLNRQRLSNITQTYAALNIPEGQPNPARKGGRHYTYVFVVCKCGKPLMSTNPAKARLLLKQGKARVFRRTPFTVQLNFETLHVTQPMEARFDYGGKVHGVALVQECKTHNRVPFFGEVVQRQDVKKKMDARRGYRRLRRYRNTRYRKPQFNNHGRPQGWVPPTITQRVESITRVVKALSKIAPLTGAVVEIGQFDTQKLVNPDVEGVGYQQGPGFGYEDRRHTVLSYFNYTCQYCGTKKGVMTEEHVIPRGRGGTDAWSNLTCACKDCNDKKGDRTPTEVGMRQPKTVNSKNSEFLKFCALMQAGKSRLIEELKKSLPLQTVYGWETKRNRKQIGLSKTHYFDALCTRLDNKPIRLASVIHKINLRRRNIRQTHLSNAKGGKRQHYNGNKLLDGFRKGDLVRTPHGLAYVNALRTSGVLQYDLNGHRYSTVPHNVDLVESVKSIQFQSQPLPPVNGVGSLGGF